MTPYDELTLDDVRDVFRLLGEVSEVGPDPREWALHLFREIDRRLGVPVANRMESSAPCDFNPRLVGLIPYGLDDRLLKLWQNYWQTQGTARDPGWAPFVERSHGSFSASRSQMVDDQSWYRSAHVMDERRAGGIDHFIVSHRVVDSLPWSHTMVLYRGWNERPFSKKEHQWLDLLHDELARSWSEDTRSKDPSFGISPRQRQTLAGLVAGESEKQIADRIGISLHTVHEYVKSLHRHFRVQSRTELVTLWLRNLTLRRPHLSVELDPTMSVSGSHLFREQGRSRGAA